MKVDSVVPKKRTQKRFIICKKEQIKNEFTNLVKKGLPPPFRNYSCNIYDMIEPKIVEMNDKIEDLEKLVSNLQTKIQNLNDITPDVSPISVFEKKKIIEISRLIDKRLEPYNPSSVDRKIFKTALLKFSTENRFGIKRANEINSIIVNKIEIK